VEIFKVKKYFALALDPIHVGTGGYRIGRVDNTIVREPATGIPKIPGTTIEGVCRSYAYLKAKENGKNIDPVCAKGKPKSETEQPCGQCEICITFGFTRKDKSMQAMTLFTDARILFFPVATMIGPVWITCPMILKDAEIKEIRGNFEEDVPEPNNNAFIIPEKCKIDPPEDKLNFGWLLLNRDNTKETNIDNWIYYVSHDRKSLKNCGIPIEILSRIVIVPDDLFVTIVNSNLEVKTSVAIDPATGAVEEGALFTYEAIPRGTVFWFEVLYQNPKNFPMLHGLNLKWNEKETTIDDTTKDEDLFAILESCVEDGLSLFQHLGVGGMGSRGFGRIRVLNMGDK